MTTAARTTATKGAEVNSTNINARLTGVLFVITFITAIPAALVLYVPVLDDPDYIVGGGGADNRVFLGAFLELLLIIATVGTALALFPILKRQNEGLALGYVAARIVECVFIGVGVLAVLGVVTLRQEAAGADEGALAYALAAIKDWTFLLGPGFFGVVGTGLMVGYLLYRSGLVPRWMAALGLVGGPLICLSGIAVLFDVFDAGGTGQAIATIPEFLWELALGLYLTVKGFRPSPIAAAYDRDAGQAAA